MEYRYKWNSEKRELWVYVCDRKKSGKRYRFKEAEKIPDKEFFPCSFCGLPRGKCKSTRNPLYPEEENNDFSEFCATVTIEDEEIKKFLDDLGIKHYRLVLCPSEIA